MNVLYLLLKDFSIFFYLKLITNLLEYGLYEFEKLC